MIVKSVTIVFETFEGKVVTCYRDKGYLWTISGAVYPRVIKLLDYISDWCKEFDLANKRERKEEKEKANGTNA